VRANQPGRHAHRGYSFVDDLPGKFLCGVDAAIAADRHARSSLATPFDGNGERPLSVSNRHGYPAMFGIIGLHDIRHVDLLPRPRVTPPGMQILPGLLVPLVA
jgi:hypothetical protein